MIEVKRVGRYTGVWRLVWTEQQAVSIKLWFSEARARKAAQKHRQTDLFDA
jgi:hypothetical protein